MKKRFTSLEEIEKEQAILKMTMKVTRQEFARSLGMNNKHVTSFMINKVAIPFGAVGLGVSAIKGLSSSNKSSKAKKSGFSIGFLNGLLPFALKLLKAYTNENKIRT